MNDENTTDEAVDSLAHYVFEMLHAREGQHPGFLCWNDEVKVMGACLACTDDEAADDAFFSEIVCSIHDNMYDYIPDEDGGMEFLQGELKDGEKVKGHVVVVAVKDGRYMEAQEIQAYLETGPKVESQTFACFGMPSSWQMVYPRPDGCPGGDGCPFDP